MNALGQLSGQLNNTLFFPFVYRVFFWKNAQVVRNGAIRCQVGATHISLLWLLSRSGSGVAGVLSERVSTLAGMLILQGIGCCLDTLNNSISAIL
jgi:hypothetical protein